MTKLTQKTPSVQLITISAAEAGQRIDNFLITLEKGVPKSRIYRAIRKGEVRVNKGRIKQTYRLQATDEVRVPPLRVSEKTTPTHISDSLTEVLQDNILFEDEHLLVLNKPAGLAVHAGTQIQLGVIEALRLIRPEADFLELIHRLDRDTSGCLLLAKSRMALLHVQQQMIKDEIDKHYLTVTRGHWPKTANLVTFSLQKNTLAAGERMVVVDTAGKQAKTQFTVKQSLPQCQLIDVKLFTGRTHQIRVHAAASGHPVAGDDKYGDREFNKQLKPFGLNRMFLHAWRLQIHHPVTGETLNLMAPLPTILDKVIQKLDQAA